MNVHMLLVGREDCVKLKPRNVLPTHVPLVLRVKINSANMSVTACLDILVGTRQHQKLVIIVKIYNRMEHASY